MLKHVLTFCLFACLAFAKHEQYEGHSLYDVEVSSKDQADFINGLKYNLNIDIWTYPSPGKSGKVLVSPEQKSNFQNAMDAVNIKYKVEVENIKEELDLEDKLLAAAKAKSNSTRSGMKNGRLSFDEIHTYETINNYLEDLANRFPNLVTLASAGKSIEGRDINYIKISTTNFQDKSKPIIYLQSLLHAREWVTLPSTLYAIERLVVDVRDQELQQGLDWIIMPVANPDGYVWSHENARFWRKNRRRGLMINDVCIGVDLNRNFDIFWGTASSSFACFDDFHGAGPFSEPETAAIRDLIAEYGSRIVLFLDIHSFGSLILYGYGNGQLPSNALGVHVVGVDMAQAIDRVKWPNKPDYRVGNVALILYNASGGCGDYAMATGIPFSYTYELPSFNNIQGQLNGFLVDPAFIEQAGFETWEGIKSGAWFVLDNYTKRNAMLR